MKDSQAGAASLQLGLIALAESTIAALAFNWLLKRVTSEILHL
jgi:hypothetical protein